VARAYLLFKRKLCDTVFIDVGKIMAIQNIYPTGAFSQKINYEEIIVYSAPRSYSSKTRYEYRCKDLKEDPSTIVKWCRRNLGERGNGWDFMLTSGNITIEIWNDKLKFMYEMWKT
jgi:hypothetical protein